MANITNVGFMARLRSDASHHVIRYRAGKIKQSGRGLVFWFRPDVASIAELPMDDRETTVFLKGRSADFQAVNVQGAIGWRIADPERIAERIDFTIALRGGQHQGQPLEKIEARLTASSARRLSTIWQLLTFAHCLMPGSILCACVSSKP
jgi:hypothetical protein